MAAERLHIAIDRAGRVVIPKSIRERFGMSGGSEFEVIEEGEHIVLKPIPRDPQLIEKKGVLVIHPTQEYDDAIIEGTRDALREERDRRSW